MKRGVRVCMFVWNYFTNDARVTREAKSLVNAGNDVYVLAVYNEKDPALSRKEIKDGINIIRLSRYGFIYQFNKWLEKILNKKIEIKRLEIKRIKIPKKYFLLAAVIHLFLSIYYIFMFVHNSFRFLYRPIRRFVVRPLIRFTRTLIRLPGRWITKLTKGRDRLFIAFIIMTCKFTAQGLAIKADIYHSHDLNTLLAGYICSRIKRARLIYDSHEIATDRAGLKAKPFWELLERMLIKKADVVIFTTYTRAKFSADKYHIGLPSVISNYADIPPAIKQIDLKKLLDIAPDCKIALYQGGIQLGRGLEQLIESVEFLREDTIVVLMGDGLLRPLLQNMVQSRGFQDRVKFTGRVPLNELLGYTAGADVGLQILQNMCFNHYSTDSNKLFEYFAVGVPVVASDFPEIAKVVKEFDAGVLIDPHKPENIAKGINYILENESRRAEMAKNAKRASLKYNWANEERRFFSIYEALTNNKKCSNK